MAEENKFADRQMNRHTGPIASMHTQKQLDKWRCLPWDWEHLAFLRAHPQEVVGKLEK